MRVQRSPQGNMLILIVAVLMGLLTLFCLFGLGFLRFLGSNSEQKTAIEAAALAAARDLSKIVINTPEFGLVGISDSAPNSQTQAVDGYGVPVTSINTIIGTARLDYVIGDQTGIEVWKELAAVDLDNAVRIAADLELALKNAVTDGGYGFDKDGNRLHPHASAESAYLQNQVRISGSSNYVPGSLQLSLGAMRNGTSTCVPIPQPTSTDGSLGSTNTESGFYRAYVNIPYGDKDFVFAGISNAVKLVSAADWVEQVDGLPYQVATVVRAEAAQMVSNETSTQKMLAVACALPASVFDPKPAPGALSISFPDGMPESNQTLSSPNDLLTRPYMSTVGEDECEYYKSASGDYPYDTGSNIVPDTDWPVISDPKILASNACKLAYYDWIKRAGTRANVTSLQGMLSTPFDPQGADVPWPMNKNFNSPAINAKPIPRGINHIYRFESNGMISYQSNTVEPIPYSPVSQNQIHVDCFGVLQNSAPPIIINDARVQGLAKFDVVLTGDYDMFVKIFGRRSGTVNGGKHAGEPMDDPDVAFLPTSGDKLQNPIIFEPSFNGVGAAPAPRPPKPTSPTPIPQLTPRDDFMWNYAPSTKTWSVWTQKKWPLKREMLTVYRSYSSGSGVRPTYQTTGFAAEIRFRRRLTFKDILNAVDGPQDGYIGYKFNELETAPDQTADQ